jgi:hypothetical protein
MTPSTLVLAALAQLDAQIQANDAFYWLSGYTPDSYGTSRLLKQLWEVYSAPQPSGRCETPGELVEAWYEDFHNREAA